MRTCNSPPIDPPPPGEDPQRPLTRSKYALMARVVHNEPFTGTDHTCFPGEQPAACAARIHPEEVIDLGVGGTVKNVWVDGGRTRFRNYVKAGNITMRIGGNNSEVSDNFITNTAGGGDVGHHRDDFLTPPPPCGNSRIKRNLVTAYFSVTHLSSPSLNVFSADGIGTWCQEATIEQNEIIDHGDVSLILFSTGEQRSQVHDNLILNTVVPSQAAIAMDPFFQTQNPPVSITNNFTGTVIRDNMIWTGDIAYNRIGIGVGTHPWFGQLPNGYPEQSPGVPRFGVPNMASGATVRNNTRGLASLRMRAHTGVAVSGMLNVTVQGTLRRILKLKSLSYRTTTTTYPRTGERSARTSLWEPPSRPGLRRGRSRHTMTDCFEAACT